MGNLDLRTIDSALEGGTRGLAIEPGKSQESRLYRFIAGLEKPSMPPGKRLKDEEIAVIKQWIDEGAKGGSQASTKPKPPSAIQMKMEERAITDEERKFWAFVPPVRSPLPQVGATNPVD